MAQILRGLAPAAKASRKSRRPSHTFQLRTRPWQIQPCMIAPVLPGETLKHLLVQARVVSDPIANPLVGWWLEYYFFLIKLSDLDDRETFTQMLIDGSTSTSALNESADAAYYHGWSTVNFAKKCLKRVTEEYFREEGEAWDGFTIGGMPIASVDDKHWAQSIMAEGTFDNPDIDLTGGGSPGGTSVLASEIEEAMRIWALQSQMGLIKASYEDYLASHGIRLPEAATHKPELIRYDRAWTYPTNTVDPETGAPSSAVSWAPAFRADKDRFVKEPGFIFGVQVVRPKTYRRTQTGSAVGLLTNMRPWLPLVMIDDIRTSLIPIADNTILGDISDANGAIVDIRDLFMYGDQFVNFSPTSVANGSFVDLPTAALQKRYADADDADDLFKTPDGEDAAISIRSDGVVSMDVLSWHHQDNTPSFTGSVNMGGAT